MNNYDANNIDFTIGGKTILPCVTDEQSTGWSDALNSQTQTITFATEKKSNLANILKVEGFDYRVSFADFRTTKGKQPRKIKVLKYFDFTNTKIKSDGQGGYFVTTNIINSKGEL